MSKYAEIVLNKCLGLKNNEKLLIVTDSKLYDIAKMFFDEAKKITNDVKFIKIPIPKVNGTEPSEDVAKEMLKYDVELLITSKSLSHTKARKNASDKGARIVTMPGITVGTIKRTIDIDYSKLEKVHKKIADIMDKGEYVRIKTTLVLVLMAENVLAEMLDYLQKKVRLETYPQVKFLLLLLKELQMELL